jgi:hypothetical protein
MPAEVEAGRRIVAGLAPVVVEDLMARLRPDPRPAWHHHRDRRAERRRGVAVADYG